MKITVNKNSISKAADEMLDANLGIESEIKKFLNIVSNINEAWKGSDALAYVERLSNTYIPKLQEYSKYINNYGEYLKNIPGAYELLDELYANKNINN